MKEKLERAKWFPIFILAVILLLIYNTLGNFAQITAHISRFLWVISPLFYGVLFSYFFLIPHRFLEKLFKKVRIKLISDRARGFSTISLFILLIVIIVFLINFILPILFTSVLDLAYSIPGYFSYVLAFANEIPEDSILNSFNLVETISEFGSNFINRIFNAAVIGQYAFGIISIANELLSVLLGLVVSMYMLLERDRIIGFFRSLGGAIFKKEKARDRVEKYARQVNKVLFTFIASKGLDSIINFVVVTSILLILDVPYALLLGLMAGVFNFIPYLGSLVAVIVICSLTLVTGGFGKAIQVLIPLFIFQQFDGNFIEPRIMKMSLKISPILVIIAVVAGGAYFGIFGMFLAVPIAVIIKQILLEYISHAENNDDNGDNGGREND